MRASITDGRHADVTPQCFYDAMDARGKTAVTRIQRGRYTAILTAEPEQVRRAQTFRARCFELAHPSDADSFDDGCVHVLIEEQNTDRLVACFRMLGLTGSEIDISYSAQFYELSALSEFDGSMVELGRFCVDPSCRDADVLRLAWAVVTRFVDDRDAQLLFGCSSFHGTETSRYLDAFAWLKDRHLAPRRWLPRVKAPDVFRFAARLRRRPDVKKALVHMPPLLRTYLLMGGWVSDHAVVDHHMNTLHVFTGVEVKEIPAARKKWLRAMA